MAEDLETLRRKLAARENKSGYQANVEALRQRIAELEAANGS